MTPGVVACAEAGVKGVQTDRPFAAKLSDADRMIETCKQRGTVLAGGALERANWEVEEAGRRLASGELGKRQGAAVHSYRGEILAGGSAPHPGSGALHPGPGGGTDHLGKPTRGTGRCRHRLWTEHQRPFPTDLRAGVPGLWQQGRGSPPGSGSVDGGCAGEMGPPRRAPDPDLPGLRRQGCAQGSGPRLSALVLGRRYPSNWTRYWIESATTGRSGTTCWPPSVA